MAGSKRPGRFVCAGAIPHQAETAASRAVRAIPAAYAATPADVN
jgi:hypothetical protein